MSYCVFDYSADMAKVLAGPLRSQILLQGLFGWNWTAPRSKIDMWIKQRLLADRAAGQGLCRYQCCYLGGSGMLRDAG